MGHGTLYLYHHVHVRTEEKFSSGGGLQHLGGRKAEYLHGAGELLYFVFSRKQRITGVQFGDDAAETPHVDRRRVWQAEDHLRRSVEPRLYVRVHCRHAHVNRPVDYYDYYYFIFLIRSVNIIPRTFKN